MSEKEDTDSLLHDPLSEVTRKERRMLLIVSLAGIAITKAGLIPSQIRALGINFASGDQKSLYFLVSAIVIYFIIAFFIYSTSDFLILRRLLYKEKRRLVEERVNKKIKEAGLWTVNTKNAVDLQMQKSVTNLESFLLRKLPMPTILFRTLFEFLLPIGVGIYSAYLLIVTSLALSATAQ